MNTTTTANAIYTNADGSQELVVLDDTDCLLEVVAPITEDQVDAIYAGDTEYQVVDPSLTGIEVGGGDTIKRLTVR